MGAQQQREWRRKRGTVWGATATRWEEKRESRVWNLWERVESAMERVVGAAEGKRLPPIPSLGAMVSGRRKPAEHRAGGLQGDGL